MSKPCRITFLAFIWGDIPKGRKHGWIDHDLEVGIIWADGMIEDGFEIEPMDDFNIRDYRAWCMKNLDPGSKSSIAIDDYFRRQMARPDLEYSRENGPAKNYEYRRNQISV